MPVFSTNKRARFDYDILETVEAGLVLTGPEVKSIRNKSVKLTGSFVTFHGDDATLINVHIPKYSKASSVVSYNPDRTRRLLLRKKEIDYLRGKASEQGLTVIPLSLYTKGPLIKVEIGIARGRKKYDKREKLKQRDIKREMQRRGGR